MDVCEENRLLAKLTSGGALEGAATARCHGFAGPKFSSSDSKRKSERDAHIRNIGYTGVYVNSKKAEGMPMWVTPCLFAFRAEKPLLVHWFGKGNLCPKNN